MTDFEIHLVWTKFLFYRSYSSFFFFFFKKLPIPSLVPTFVLSHFTKINSLRSFAKAIFISVIASLFPIHIRGPKPNGINWQGFIFALFSAENLQHGKSLYNAVKTKIIHSSIKCSSFNHILITYWVLSFIWKKSEAVINKLSRLPFWIKFLWVLP